MIRESCSVCTSTFDVQFRYQMEERDGGFLFFCTQKCLEESQKRGAEGAGLASCDACNKRFSVTLASEVVYVKKRRAYACSMDCRTQILREADGARLGDMLASVPTANHTSPPAVDHDDRTAPANAPPPANPPPPATVTTAATARPAPTAVVVPVMPQIEKRAAAAAAAPRQDGPRVLAVFNHKGGTGKTTTSVSVAAGLALRGKKVLIVDSDAQGNVAVSLGATVERSLYHVLVMGLRLEDAVKKVRDNLDLLASNETLAAAELYLAGRQNRDRVLRDRLKGALDTYDYVVVDCSPSLSLMNQNALVFADSVLIPVACDYLSLVGVRQVLKTVKNVNSLLHHPVQIWGVLPTFFDARAKICHEAMTTLRDHFGEKCLSPVRAAIKVKEAPAQGQTIFEYAAGTNAAEDYAAVVERLLQPSAARQERPAADTALSA